MLNEARHNYLASQTQNSDHPPFGTRWDHLRREMATAIGGFASAADAISYGQFRCGFDHRGAVTEADVPKMKIAQHLLRGFYPQFREHVPQFSETSATTPGTAIEFQSDYGPRVFASNILYFHAFYVLTIASFKNDVESICEIGGGYGNPALLWFTNPIKHVRRYAIVDLPESLFFAEMFLRTALPDVPLRYASPEQPVSHAPGIVLVPIHLSHQTDAVPFDVVVNTGSMAEMADDWVEYWRAWVDRQSADMFYSHNMIGNPVDRLQESRATMAPTVGNDWYPAYVNAMHPMARLHGDGHAMAEIIFRRDAGAQPSDPGAMFDFLKDRRMSLENYIHLLYALCRNIERNNPHVVPFAKKAISDLGYAPVELLYLLDRCDRDSGALALREDLRRRHLASYPQGAYSE